MVVVVWSYSGKPNPDALPASKNEYKQTVASEESQVEADMINFKLMEGHGYYYQQFACSHPRSYNIPHYLHFNTLHN